MLVKLTQRVYTSRSTSCFATFLRAVAFYVIAAGTLTGLDCLIDTDCTINRRGFNTWTVTKLLKQRPLVRDAEITCDTIGGHVFTKVRYIDSM